MKKYYSLMIALLIFNIASAQLVTITETHQLPVVGDSIHYIDANTFGFDAVGTGPVTAKVWDFSAVMATGTSIDFVYVNPETIPVNLGRDSFPASNIARRQSDAAGYFYYQNTANNINRLGWFVSNANFGVYKNGTFATEFHFPITAGQSFNSIYNGNYAPWGVGEDSVKITDGSLSISADMQGQMILPAGTFNGVLRLHIIENFHIKTYTLGAVAIDNLVSDDYYYWFTDTIFQPLFIYGVTTIDGTAQTPVLRYQPISPITGITNNNVEIVSIHPNPTSDHITIELSQSQKEITLTISNISGHELIRQSIRDSSISIDLSNLARGVYFVKLITDKTVDVRKIIKE